jgi:hypothetical protein
MNKAITMLALSMAVASSAKADVVCGVINVHFGRSETVDLKLTSGKISVLPLIGSAVESIMRELELADGTKVCVEGTLTISQDNGEVILAASGIQAK